MRKFAVLLAVLLSCNVSLAAEVLRGRVVGVADGDTITVLDDSNTRYRIRMLGIDAPEKAQAFGQRSKQHLSDLVFGKRVSVEWAKKDRYGRILGKVVTPEGDANLAQVMAGMAWHYKHYSGDQDRRDRDLYARAEASARAAKIGLWADKCQTAPWDWRRSR